MKRLKILHITNHFYPCEGGIESVVLNFAKAQSKKGHDVRVLTTNLSPNGKVLPNSSEENIFGIKIIRKEVKRNFFYKIFDFENLLEWADIVHVHSFGFILDKTILNKNKNKKNKFSLVLSTHGLFHHTNNRKFLKFIYGLWLKFGLKKVDLIIADSKNDFQLASKYVDEKKILIFENGIDFHKFFNSKNKKIKNLFLYVGRFSKNKRIDFLIDTFFNLKKYTKDFRFIIAGRDFDNLDKQMRKRILNLNLEQEVKIVHSPSNTDIISLYSSADFFVSASEYEGFGLTILEGMSAGAIPLVSKNNSFPNIINDKEEGFFIKYHSPLVASKEIYNIINQNLSAVRNNTILRAKSYDWKTKSDELERIYFDVLNNSNKL